MHDLDLAAKGLQGSPNPHEYRVMSLGFERRGLAAAGERGGGEPAQEAAGLNAPRPAAAGSRRE
jgi:hypothetical protein